ncbi:hypothetical protein ONS95_004726 [Cadophora gregata]|uniref:uncharacterized protein n=1 Tax=Cadophora gregata TaxID=51156 RepID=UPI0026DD1531|nr:uncharacterized protein ONS95_004726 [Cadophora gregata]KAK0104436.1 hypothetical protein ONS95_004726 [Cadophora gregata]
MAILPAVPGLEVTIQSLNQDLPEYDDDGDFTQSKFAHLPEGQRSQKFVECKTNAEFRIRLVLKHPYRMDCQSLAFKANVDGHGIAQATCTDAWFGRCSGYYMELITARLDRISPTQLSSRTLKFSSIKKVDDPDSSRVKKDAKALAGIGEIVVSVHRAVQRDSNPPVVGNYNLAQHKPPEEVAEKALKGKAISHGVSYGEQQIVTRTAKETVDLDGPHHPIGVFVFKYRSREDLQAELIIPRSPSPEPVPTPLRARSSNGNNAKISAEARLAHLKVGMIMTETLRKLT